MTDFEIFMKSNNLRQQDLADYLNTSQAYISQLKRGLRQLPADTLAFIKANEEWDTSMLSEQRGGVNVRTGDVSARASGSGQASASVSAGGSGELEVLRAQVAELREQNARLMRIIENLTAGH